MKLSLDQVEREVARLRQDEARATGAPRMELLTLVALVSEPSLFERTMRVVSDVADVHPSRTIVALWKEGASPTITADVALHRSTPGGPSRGDAIVLEAVGAARDWLPENAARLALPDLPMCVWWAGDLPDYDDLFDRMVVGADLVIVDSAEMDLRDLEKLSGVATRSAQSLAIADLTWIRLQWLQELIARFFDDEAGRAQLPRLERVTIEFSPRPGEKDVASTIAGLLFGWMARAIGLRPEGVRWTRGDTWSEASFERLVARFEQRARPDVSRGDILRARMECADGVCFEIERQDDPQVFRWSREMPGASTPPQLLRVLPVGEAALLVRTLERPKRDRLLDASLQIASRILRPVAPRLSMLPP